MISTMPKLYKILRAFPLFSNFGKKKRQQNRQAEREREERKKETIILNKSNKKTKLLKSSKLETLLYVKKMNLCKLLGK